MPPTLIYCYDAYCGWCYGFSNVMVRVFEKYKNEIREEIENHFAQIKVNLKFENVDIGNLYAT